MLCVQLETMKKQLAELKRVHSVQSVANSSLLAKLVTREDRQLESNKQREIWNASVNEATVEKVSAYYSSRYKQRHTLFTVNDNRIHR